VPKKIQNLMQLAKVAEELEGAVFGRSPVPVSERIALAQLDAQLTTISLLQDIKQTLDSIDSNTGDLSGIKNSVGWVETYTQRTEEKLTEVLDALQEH
jgi:hypothetical protein